MYKFSDGISRSDKITVATADMPTNKTDYHFRKLVYPDVCIPNRSLAWSLSFKPEDAKEIIELKEKVLEYNDYVEYLESLPGFAEFFLENNLCVSKEAVAKKWSEDIAEEVFNKGSYCFLTDISTIDDWLFDNTYPLNYAASIDGNDIHLPIGENAEAYSNQAGNCRIIWNYTDIGHDFCYYIWEILGERYRQNEDSDDEYDDDVTYSFDTYDQFRYDFVEPQLVRIFEKLENLGYVDSYTIVPSQEDPRWKQYGKTDGSIDCALVDTSFLKNKLIMEQIELLLWTKAEELSEKSYFLTDSCNRQYLSNTSGSFGGHRKLKIYGRLDCPSAARYLAKGQYAQNRVFFPDEETAIKAGYRPCAKCMPEEYKRWKTNSK